VGSDRQAGSGVPGGLSLAELCDVAYVMLLERAERHLGLTVAFVAAGATTEDVPSWTFSQESIDSWLGEESEQDTEQAELLRALGVR
jgi:hypothetical protein